MLNFGIIGMNDGNGHPYSFSAIFNGYNEDALEECPYSAIKEYLPVCHRNEMIIPDANVTHIWTQDKKLSESVAGISRIPNIVNNPELYVRAAIISDRPHSNPTIPGDTIKAWIQPAKVL